jgi:DNA-binding transcriptional ArsR family regulator
MKIGTGYERQAELFRALAHPVRLRILDVLARQDACVCHLTAMLGQRQPYVSQQLAALREANLVSDRREGTLVYYRLADHALADLLDESKNLLRGRGREPLTFEPVPEGALDECPCPRCQARAPVRRPEGRKQEAWRAWG